MREASVGSASFSKGYPGYDSPVARGARVCWLVRAAFPLAVRIPMIIKEAVSRHFRVRSQSDGLRAQPNQRLKLAAPALKSCVYLPMYGAVEFHL